MSNALVLFGEEVLMLSLWRRQATRIVLGAWRKPKQRQWSVEGTLKYAFWSPRLGGWVAETTRAAARQSVGGAGRALGPARGRQGGIGSEVRMGWRDDSPH